MPKLKKQKPVQRKPLKINTPERAEATKKVLDDIKKRQTSDGNNG